jgi:DNA-binding SARP family transcriptional activator
MKTSPFLAKISRPPLSGVFPRTRLFEMLDRINERPVIWISGPPGSGKTTLVSSYIEARGTPCLWYQIDESDSEPSTFFYFMGLATQTASSNHLPLPLLTSEYIRSMPAVTLQYFETLYNYLKNQGAVVFDDYQEVAPDSLFHEVIRNGLSQIPPGINIILISRRDPPPALIRTCMSHQTEILNYSSLRLTSEESREIIRLRTSGTFSEDAMCHLHKLADGWVAGLILMLLKAKADGTDPQMMLKNSHIPAEIFDYFTNEIFDRTDKAIREFLIRTAFLPGMNIKMAETLTGCSGAAQILSELIRSQSFTEKILNTDGLYRYHPLFRAFLISRAKESLSSEALEVLCREAAMLLEEFSETEGLSALLKDIDNSEARTRLIIKHAPDAAEKGKIHTLEEWLNTLPEDIIENTPRLLCWRALCSLPYQPSQSMHCFEKAFEGFKKQQNPEGMFLAWTGIIDAIVYRFEKFEQLDKWLRVLEELMPDTEAFPSDEIRNRVISRVLAILAFSPSQHPQSEKWAGKEALPVKKDWDISVKIPMLFYLFFCHIRKGDFEKAGIVLNGLRQQIKSEETGGLSRLSAGYAQAVYYHFTQRHEDCLRVVSECLELSRTSGVHILDCQLTAQSVASALDANDRTTAKNLLRKMGTSFNFYKPWEAALYHYLKCREAFLGNILGQADIHADLALKSARDTGYPFLSGLCHLMKACVLHELEKYQDADFHLSHVMGIARETKNKFLKFRVFWTEAWFAWEQEDEISCLKSLRKATSLGRKNGYLNIFTDRPAINAKLCAKALDADIEADYVRQMIRKHNLTPDNIPLYLDSWPWPLKIFTLGRFSVVKEGEPVRFSGKTQQKPLSMLKALLAFGGREVREDQIADALWPDADGDMAHKSFATTLHRLRRLLGDRKIIKLRDGRLTLDQKYCWVDIWAFQRTFGQADTAWRRKKSQTNMARIVELTQKAIDIYKGPFLIEEEGESWTIPLRERLRSKFIRGVSNLGRYWESLEQWEKAAECYQLGLEVDNLAEDLYQRLMICYHRMSLRAEALTVYERCRQMLSVTLGITPSPNTETIRDSLFCKRHL